MMEGQIQSNVPPHFWGQGGGRDDLLESLLSLHSQQGILVGLQSQGD